MLDEEVTKERIERTFTDKFAGIVKARSVWLTFHSHGHTKMVGGKEQGFIVSHGIAIFECRPYFHEGVAILH